MRTTVSPEVERAVAEVAQRHEVSHDAVLAMLLAVSRGGGTMAQFSIPELGGSGQWIRGGMTMVGNMFDHALKARVDALCSELSELVTTSAVFPDDSQVGVPSSSWWPGDLGVPSSFGGQNDARYAIFPATRRLAIQVQGVTRVFDTGEHHIGGVAQQQGVGPGAVTFTSQLGTFDVSSLPEVEGDASPEAPAAEPPPASSTGGTSDSEDILATIESLAGLHQRGILTDDEFTAKKAELLARL
ncbi:SHOCT domain-containing protein [Williamsia sp.]|uniref:SHOCT domain-containing protein n=1 Tax=Williamsia sp. TaxID=1872085 RepID=UPI001A1A75A2|nr:SHOCT domain-containing protein [Williamsia sp.]MBJ7290162.1 SHOCT domain-containing protein [Williamsia sp.]